MLHTMLVRPYLMGLCKRLPAGMAWWRPKEGARATGTVHPCTKQQCDRAPATRARPPFPQIPQRHNHHQQLQVLHGRGQWSSPYECPQGKRGGSGRRAGLFRHGSGCLGFVWCSRGNGTSACFSSCRLAVPHTPFQLK
jgi:hypothetical protein